jgi:alkyl sulfatase BDS1-like metallo-beta-lactamase superfamily hydrolase
LLLAPRPDDQEALALKANFLAALGNASYNLFYVNFYLHEAEKLRR